MDGGTHAIIRMYQDRAHWLQVDVNALRRELSQRGGRIQTLQRDNDHLRAENAKLQQRIKELTATSSKPDAEASSEAPAFVKANVPDRSRRKPGRRKGHVAALRPM